MKLFRPKATIYYRDGILMDKKKVAEMRLSASTVEEAFEEVFEEYSCCEDVQFFITDEDLETRFHIVVAEGRILAGCLTDTKLV